MKATVGLIRIGVFPCLGTEQLIFLLELLQPDGAVHLCMAFRAPDGRGKEHGLVPDDVVAERKSLALVVPSPVGQSTLNVRKFSLGPFDGRSAPIFRVKIFLFLPQDFGHGARRKKNLAAGILSSLPPTQSYLLSTPKSADCEIVSMRRPDPG